MEKGSHHTKEHNARMSEIMKGRRVTWADKISKSNKLDYLTNSRRRERMVEIHKGIAQTPEHRANLSKAQIKRFEDPNERLKISIWNTTHNHKPNLGNHHTDEAKEKIRIARAKQVFPVKDTIIERMVQSYLESKGMIKWVDFIPHKPFRVGDHYHQVDIYIPLNDYCIECDGVYWHNRLGDKEKDFFIDSELFNQGVNVVRLSQESIENGEFKETLNFL